MTATGVVDAPVWKPLRNIYRPGVTLITATIPPRGALLAELAGCVGRQERPPDAWLIEYDLDHKGPGLTRNRALARVDTEWTAVIDDDDEPFPQHLRRLVEHAEETAADVVYPTWQYASGRKDPTSLSDTAVFDPVKIRDANYIPVTVLVRTMLAKAVGGFPSVAEAPTAGNDHPCEDWGLWLRLLDAGARFEHLCEVTWRYNPHGGQYGGYIW